MERVHERNPKDQEAAIFYALALVATAAPEDKTYATSGKRRHSWSPCSRRIPIIPEWRHYYPCV